MAIKSNKKEGHKKACLEWLSYAISDLAQDNPLHAERHIRWALRELEAIKEGK